MDATHEFDYTVNKKVEGKYLLARILMIIGYVVFGAVYFFGMAFAHLYPLMAFIILLEWILIFFTWRYVSIEYKYETVSGGIRFYIVYGGKKKKLLLEKRIKEFSAIAPYDSDSRASLAQVGANVKYFCARSEKSDIDCFYALYDTEKGKEAIVFEATQASLKFLRFYNQNTVVTETRY